LKRTLGYLSVLLFVPTLFADISVTDKQSALRTVGHVHAQAIHITPAQKQALRDANQAKRDAKRAKRKQGTSSGVSALEYHAKATGSRQLIDSSGLQYFINTDITFSTSSSASGAASEASYTGPVVASTSGGGTTTSTLSDMFDGYEGLCVSLGGSTGPCQTGNAAYIMYNQNGPAAFDTTVPATPECTNRQLVLPAKTMGALSIGRKIYVPTNDQFIRWIESVTNTSGAPVTFTLVTSNNLGSDANTRIVSSSSGDNVAQTSDTWVSTFQAFSGNTSSDPRIGHVLQGAGAPTPVSSINFADGDDNPYWAYSITLAPGQTKSIMHFATGQGTKALANAKAAALAGLSATSTQCMSNTELTQVANFAVSTDLSIVKTASVLTNVNAGQAYSYTLAVTNNGPTTASSVSVSDPLPAGVSFVSASGTGWTCGQLAGTVTCTLPTLAVGAANPITINVTAPNNTAVLTNTATISAATTDPTPGNNSSTNVLTVVPQADLSITKNASSPTVDLGAAYSYTLQVSNAGPSTASAVSVSDTLPAGVSFVSASGTGWTCGQSLGVVTCTNPSLAVGAANPITINVTAPPSTTGTKNNTAGVSAGSVDPNPANNTSGVSAVNVVPNAHLTVTHTTGAAVAYGGQPVTYTSLVSNSGPTGATNVAVANTLPAGSSFVSAAGTGWTCANVAGVVTCTMPFLPVGAASPISLVINAPATVVTTTLSNTAGVTGTGIPVSPAPPGSSSTAAIPLQPASAIPLFDPKHLVLMAIALATAAIIVMKRNG
jgi:uncharacterized repeat protein (TIGR01451 family)